MRTLEAVIEVPSEPKVAEVCPPISRWICHTAL